MTEDTGTARVIVCGSRGWNDRQRIQDVLADVAEELGTCDLTIVHGAARGADRIAAEEAGKHGFLVEPHRADWNGYTREDFERFGHKGAGRKRNQHMADLGAVLCVAFWDGSSTGTKDMTDRAEQAGIRIRLEEKHAPAAASVVCQPPGEADET